MPQSLAKSQPLCPHCVGHVAVTRGCRVVVRLPNDRAPIACRTTQNIFSMSAVHESHRAYSFVCDSESRYQHANKSA
jgi:hypothetical protein